MREPSSVRETIMSHLIEKQHTFSCMLCGAPINRDGGHQSLPSRAWIAVEHCEHPKVKAVVLEICEECRHLLCQCRYCTCFLLTDDQGAGQGVCRAHAPRGVQPGGHRASMPLVLPEASCIHDFRYLRPLTIAEVDERLAGHGESSAERSGCSVQRGSFREDVPWPTAELYLTYSSTEARDALIDEIDRRNKSTLRPWIILVSDVVFDLATDAGCMLYDVPLAEIRELGQSLCDTTPGISFSLDRPKGFNP